MKLRWTRPALTHLDAIGDWIAAENPAAAQAVVHRVHAAVERLKDHPTSGRPGRVAGTRELVVSRTPYIVAYAVGEEHVSILAVFHARRRWPEAF